MSAIDLSLNGGQVAFWPGEQVQLRIGWNLPHSQDVLELSVVWRSGNEKGRELPVQYLHLSIEEAAGEWLQVIHLPHEPYSFELGEFGICWEIQVRSRALEETFRLPIVIGPESRGINAQILERSITATENLLRFSCVDCGSAISVFRAVAGDSCQCPQCGVSNLIPDQIRIKPSKSALVSVILGLTVPPVGMVCGYLIRRKNRHTPKSTDYRWGTSGAILGVAMSLVFMLLAVWLLTMPLTSGELRLGQEMAGEGIVHVEFSDGVTEVVEIGGVVCRRLVPVQGAAYFYFAVDPELKTNGLSRVFIELDYYDEKYIPLDLDYDSTDSSATMEGRYKRMDISDSLGLNEWHTISIELGDARFENRQNQGADFRIATEGGELALKRVKIKVIPTSED